MNIFLKILWFSVKSAMLCLRVLQTKTVSWQALENQQMYT